MYVFTQMYTYVHTYTHECHKTNCVYDYCVQPMIHTWRLDYSLIAYSSLAKNSLTGSLPALESPMLKTLRLDWNSFSGTAKIDCSHAPMFEILAGNKHFCLSIPLVLFTYIYICAHVYIYKYMEIHTHIS